MKVNFEKVNVNELIGALAVGDTFIVDHKSHPNEIALYMKVDGTSDFICNHSFKNYAVNLATGQLLEFYADTFVERAPAEVFFSK